MQPEGLAIGYPDSFFFLLLLRLEANSDMVSMFLVIAACFSCNLPDLNSSKLNPIAFKVTKIIFPNNTIQQKFIKSKCHCPCLKPLFLTILTPLLSQCCYLKDKREKSGNLLKRTLIPPSPKM